MKNLALTTIIATTVLTTPGLADQANIKDHYKTVSVERPYTETVCRDVTITDRVQVGTTGTGQANLGDFLTGALIGGAIGNNVSNKDNAGALGAIIGGAIAAEKGKKGKPIYENRTRVENRCNNVSRVEYVQEQRYSHSTIRFTHNGKTRILTFQR